MHTYDIAMSGMRMVNVRAAEIVMGYLFGKPKESVEVELIKHDIGIGGDRSPPPGYARLVEVIQEGKRIEAEKNGQNGNGH